jgi:hypothetical protein
MSGDVSLGLAKSGRVGTWFGPGLPDLSVLEVRPWHSGSSTTRCSWSRNRVVATARFSEHAADGSDAWIISSLPSRLIIRNQAITARTVAELLATGREPTRRS